MYSSVYKGVDISSLRISVWLVTPRSAKPVRTSSWTSCSATSWSSTRTSGCSVWKSRRSGGRRRAHWSAGAATERRPLLNFWKSAAPVSIRDHSWTIRCAESNMAWPAVLSLHPRVWRSNKLTPNKPSSFWILALSDDFETLRRSAARAKCPVSATIMKARNWSIDAAIVLLNWFAVLNVYINYLVKYRIVE